MNTNEPRQALTSTTAFTNRTVRSANRTQAGGSEPPERGAPPRRRRTPPPAGDDTSVNMTPMIDMTFLLVVFFMLSIDLTQKEFIPVDLPFAGQGVPDEPDPNDPIPRFVVNLESDGTVVFKGQRYSLSADDPVAQEAAIAALRSQLSGMTQDLQLREPEGASKIPVMIHGDRAAKWQYVQWIMQVCAQPSIQIYKLQFAVTKPATDAAEGE